MEVKKINFRTLREDEIECRVGTVTDKGVSLLMYKNARVDMQLLDEVVGAENWKRSHELINGNLFCTVSVRSENGEWVSKQDVGVESNTEKEKGQASDAFKRACVNWGIGRELYTSPFVWVNLKQDEWKMAPNGRKQPKVRFEVKAIEYDDLRRVSYLVVNDSNGTVRYKFGTSMAAEKTKAALIEAIQKATSREEVEKLYKAHKSEADSDVIDACTKRCKELEAAA